MVIENVINFREKYLPLGGPLGAVIEQVHEQSEVLEEQLTFGLHNIPAVTFFTLQGQRV